MAQNGETGRWLDADALVAAGVRPHPGSAEFDIGVAVVGVELARGREAVHEGGEAACAFGVGEEVQGLEALGLEWSVVAEWFWGVYL